MKKLITILILSTLTSCNFNNKGYNKKPFIVTGKQKNYGEYGLTKYEYVDSSGCSHYFTESDYEKTYLIGDTLK